MFTTDNMCYYFHLFYKMYMYIRIYALNFFSNMASIDKLI